MSFSDKFCGKSPFKHYKGKNGKILDPHSHRDAQGDVSYHSQSRDTGRTKSYKLNKNNTLVQTGSSVGSSGF